MIDGRTFCTNKSDSGKAAVIAKAATAFAERKPKTEKRPEKLQSEKLQKETDLQALIQQLETVKIGGSQWSASEKAIMEKRIDGYLKEIEKCLLLLNA